MEVLNGFKKAATGKQRDSTRQPLLPAEKNNVVTVTRRPRTMEVSSRYRSPTPTKTRRSPSPNVPRAVSPSPSSQTLPKRALSAERKRSSTPSTPSTPVTDTSIDLPVKLYTGRLPESLWPSTMRSLSVSFQSDTISVPVSKKEKPLITSPFDRTLRPSSNVTTSVSRKHTPERKRSPLKGKNSSGKSENSKPVEHHMWPSRIGGKITSNSMNKSLDFGDKAARFLSNSGLGLGHSSIRRMSLPLQKSCSDTARLLSLDGNGVLSPTKSEDSSLVWTSASSFDRATLATAVSSLYPLSAPGSRPGSPSRSSFSSSSSSSISRGMSPCRGVSPLRGLSPCRGVSPLRGLSPFRGANPSCARPSTPPLRGVSPARIRQASTSAVTSTTSSVLSFMADVKKGKKANFIEDIHQLRLLYNRYSQWRFGNARAEGVRYFQRLIAEETLYNVWHATSELRDLVTNQQICLQQLKLEIKLESILNDQMVCLEDWAILERDHVSSLAGAIGDLEANTLRLPLAGGTKVDLESLKLAMSLAFDVMQATGSSICSLFSQVEDMNKLVSDLAFVATKESVMLNKCENLLASTAVMEIEESSLMTNLIQKKQEEEEMMQRLHCCY